MSRNGCAQFNCVDAEKRGSEKGIRHTCTCRVRSYCCVAYRRISELDGVGVGRVRVERLYWKARKTQQPTKQKNRSGGRAKSGEKQKTNTQHTDARIYICVCCAATRGEREKRENYVPPEQTVSRERIKNKTNEKVTQCEASHVLRYRSIRAAHCSSSLFIEEIYSHQVLEIPARDLIEQTVSRVLTVSVYRCGFIANQLGAVDPRNASSTRESESDKLAIK